MRFSVKVFAVAIMAAVIAYLGNAVAAESMNIEDCMKCQNKARKQIATAAKKGNWDDAAKSSKSWLTAANDIGKNKPPIGDPKSWKEQTTKYLTNVKAVDSAVGKKDASAPDQGARHRSASRAAVATASIARRNEQRLHTFRGPPTDSAALLLFATMNEPLSLIDYERQARDLLQRTTYEYFAAGAGAEITLRENREAYDTLRLRPRVLVPVSGRNQEITLLGQTIASPILVAPMALSETRPPGRRTRNRPGLRGRGRHLCRQHRRHLLARRNCRRERRARNGFNSMCSRIGASLARWSNGPKPPATMRSR